MKNYVLGIDLGTTSVKVSILDADTNEVIEYYSKDTNCEVQGHVEGAHEQFVPTIISTLNICVSKLSDCLRKNTVKIGVCGQMHGILFWKTDKDNYPWMFQQRSYRIDENKVSRLYTWQDGRCNQAFLATLPKPDSHLGISTGFGIPTCFWLKRNTPEYLRKYNRSGLLSSFVVAMLCNQDSVFTSYQNAASWGYFNCSDLQWNLKILEKADFPVELLPRLKSSGEMAGTLSNSWYDIPEGVPVGVDLGDLQCSVMSTLVSEQDAVINFSTSSQMAFLVNNFSPPPGPPSNNALSYWPYFNNQYIAVAASLNGGNVLVFFVNMLQGWLSDFGESLDNDKLWERLISLGMADTTNSDLEVKPTCMGERFEPNLLGSVSNVTGTNVALGHVFKILCRGIIENLHNMLPAKMLNDAKIKRIVGNGTGLYKNQILQKEIERIYRLPLDLVNEGDASKGAAMAVQGNTYSNSGGGNIDICDSCS